MPKGREITFYERERIEAYLRMRKKKAKHEPLKMKMLVERVHRTMDEGYYQNIQRIWKTPYECLHYYNFERIHLTLNGKTPHEKWLSVTYYC